MFIILPLSCLTSVKIAVRSSLLAISSRWLAGAAVALLGLAAGCTYSHGDPEPRPDPTVPVTYAAVISPLFDANCRQCHGSGVYTVLGGGINYGDHAAIKSFYSASWLLACVEQVPGTSYNAMPKGRPKLSVADIERLKVWIAAGEPNN